MVVIWRSLNSFLTYRSTALVFPTLPSQWDRGVLPSPSKTTLNCFSAIPCLQSKGLSLELLHETCRRLWPAGPTGPISEGLCNFPRPKPLALGFPDSKWSKKVSIVHDLTDSRGEKQKANSTWKIQDTEAGGFASQEGKTKCQTLSWTIQKE